MFISFHGFGEFNHIYDFLDGEYFKYFKQIIVVSKKTKSTSQFQTSQKEKKNLEIGYSVFETKISVSITANFRPQISGSSEQA